MNKIAERTENSLDYRSIVSQRSRERQANMTEAISQAVAFTSINLGVKAVLAPTESGNTAKMIAKYRPGVPIIAVTGSENTAHMLTLVWGVNPVVAHRVQSTDEILELAVDASLKSGHVDHGDVVVITAGVPVGEAGTTNLMKVHVIGDLLAKGQGIGKQSVVGKAVIAQNAGEALALDTEGYILVTMGTDREMMPAIENCIGIIAEEGGLTSHAAVVGLSLGIPVIVGVKEATKLIRSGQEITMDAETGVIYKGHASVL